MFEEWPTSEVLGPPFRMVVDPPEPVTVDLDIAIPSTAPGFGGSRMPLRVTAGGLVLSGRIPGLLHAWARSADGTWIGLVEMTVTTGNKRGKLPMLQWCPRRALEPEKR